MIEDDPHQIPDEPPPVLGTWPRVYIFILVCLAMLIFAFYLFTVHYAP